jgi:hypothetical protein
VSGTGIVAYGARFPGAGKVAVSWSVNGMPGSVGVWDCIEDMQAVHGHGGATEVVWLAESMPSSASRLERTAREAEARYQAARLRGGHDPSTERPVTEEDIPTVELARPGPPRPRWRVDQNTELDLTILRETAAAMSEAQTVERHLFPPPPV